LERERGREIERKREKVVEQTSRERRRTPLHAAIVGKKRSVNRHQQE